jgi:hypothetical protein
LPLARFYETASRWPRLIAQNELLDPPKVDDRRLLFYVENQGVCAWATDRVGANPPVWGRIDGDEFTEEEPLSRFLIQVALFESVMGAEHGASVAWLHRDGLERVLGPLELLPIGAWRWPSYPTRFYASDDALGIAGPNPAPDTDDYLSVNVAGRDSGAVAFLDDIVDDGWEFYSRRD